MSNPDDSLSPIVAGSPLLAAANAVWARHQKDAERLQQLRARYDRLVFDIEADLPVAPYSVPAETWSTPSDVESESAYSQRRIDDATARIAELKPVLSKAQAAKKKLETEKLGAVAFERRGKLGSTIRSWLGEQHRPLTQIDADISAVDAVISQTGRELDFAKEDIDFNQQNRDAYAKSEQYLDEWKADVAHWAKGHAAEFALEDRTLEAIGKRRELLQSEVESLLPDFKTDSREIELVVNMVYFADTYGDPGRSVEDVVLQDVGNNAIREAEQIAISRDIKEFLPIQQRREDAALGNLMEGWAKLIKRFVPDGTDLQEVLDEELGRQNSYLAGVYHGAFAAPGQQDERPPTSFDRHYRGTFGDDWRYGVMADIGPSGTDEESYVEMEAAAVWDKARLMQEREFSGTKAIPYAPGYVDAATDFIDRAYNASFAQADDMVIGASIDYYVMSARETSLQSLRAIDNDVAVDRQAPAIKPRTLELGM